MGIIQVLSYIKGGLHITNNIRKNKFIATALSFVFCELGNIYNGLYYRGIVEFGIEITLAFIFSDLLKTLPYGLFIMFLIGFVWWAYVLYDTMSCTDAINENRNIPLFLNKIKIK